MRTMGAVVAEVYWARRTAAWGCQWLRWLLYFPAVQGSVIIGAVGAVLAVSIPQNDGRRPGVEFGEMRPRFNWTGRSCGCAPGTTRPDRA